MFVVATEAGSVAQLSRIRNEDNRSAYQRKYWFVVCRLGTKNVTLLSSGKP